MSTEWKIEVLKLVDRYSKMTSSVKLRDFCAKLATEIDLHPEIKISRWLGYIQGQVIAEGKTTVTVERDYTRPILAPLENKLKIEYMQEEIVKLQRVADAASRACIDLCNHLEKANKEYIAGDIPRGMFQYVLIRHGDLHTALYEAGYTEKHKFFDFPIKPDATAHKPPLDEV